MKSGIISFLAKTTTSYFFLVLLLAVPCRAEAFWSDIFWVQVEGFWLTPERNKEKKMAAPPVAQATVSQGQMDNFQGNITNMAKQLFHNLEDKDPQVGSLADGLACTVFVDLKNLTRTSSFGRYLSEQLMSEFQRQGYRVVEVRKSQAIMVQEKRGEYGLSRNPVEIDDALAVRTILTGTYALAGDNILVNAKILDNKDATMLSSATVLFPKNDLAEDLLADSVATHPETAANAPMYMKKLEL